MLWIIQSDLEGSHKSRAVSRGRTKVVALVDSHERNSADIEQAQNGSVAYSGDLVILMSAKFYRVMREIMEGALGIVCP